MWTDSEGEIHAVMTREEVVTAVNRWRRSPKAKELVAKIKAERDIYVNNVIRELRKRNVRG